MARRTSRTDDTATDDPLTLAHAGSDPPPEPPPGEPDGEDGLEKPHKTCSDGAKVGASGVKKGAA